MNLPRKSESLLLSSLVLGLPLGTIAGAEEILSSQFGLRSASEGATLFTELSPERTGIVTTNAYEDPRIWGQRHSEHSVGAIGTGVAVGDYDGDGRPDLFVVSKIESGRLFRNLGNWRFEDATAAAGLLDTSGEWKQGAAFADVDNDGLLDLYVCRLGAPNQLFVNQGNGGFREEAGPRGLAVVDGSGMASFADYDRDGWLDVYIQTNLLDVSASPEGQRDYLFRNNGDGTFSDVSDAAGILARPTQGHSATWWDQDEDGWLDLYVANDFGPPDFLYRNNRDGTFANVIDQALSHTPFSSMGSDVGDVDNDGRIDFFVADMAGLSHEFTQRGLADSRARMDPSHNDQMDQAIQTHSNALYLNTGLSRSLEAAHLAGLAGTDWTWSTLFADLDQDGRLDLFVTNGMDREHNNLDFIVRKLSAVNLANRIRITKASPVLNQRNLAFVNRGGLRFEEVGEQWGLDHLGVSFGAAYGDFDGDGDLDLVYTNFQQGATMLRNDGQSGHSVIIELRGVASNRFGIGARVEAFTRSGRQVRQLSSARGYLSSSEPAAHFGLGDDVTIESLKISWPSGRAQTFRGLAAGHRYTVSEPESGEAPAKDEEEAPLPLFEVVSESMNLAVTQREEEREGTVPQALLPRRFNRRGPGIAIGDLTGDGRDEVVFGATARDAARLFTGEEARLKPFKTAANGAAPPINDGPPLIFDANGDGWNDLLFTAGGAALPAEEPEYEPRLWLNDRAGGFVPAPEGFLPTLPISVGAAVAADFDRDGALDLFLGGRLLPGYYPEAAYSALLLRSERGFSDATARFAPELAEIGLVTSALATDLDGDGWMDLLVALEWGGVRFLRNREGEALVDESEQWGFESAGYGLWSSVAAADFNEDGRMDLVLGNLGLNTHFTATRDHPMKLFAGRFAGGSETQLVLAYNLEGRLAPVASRDELAAKIPAVRQRFPSNDAFAAARLEEVLDEGALAKSEVYVIEELRSGLLLSQPSGRFAFEPLPRLAQIAPVQGLVAADFDGDGSSDVLLVGNDYSSIPAQGRFDGGLGWLLLGDGKGGFEPVEVARSGWQVPGNAKALALIDLDRDARPDAVASRNNQSALAFRHARAADSRWVALRLKGRNGNPAAIGARARLRVEGKRLQLAEARAGGGYSSQSTATLFFSLPESLAGEAVIELRWPSGATAEVPFPDSSGYLEVSE